MLWTIAIFSLGRRFRFCLIRKGNVQRSPTNYTFVGADVPTLLWRYVFSSPPLERIEGVDVVFFLLDEG